MDYGLLPPEVNSGRLYAGPGSTPMLASAAAWDGLSRGLYGAATEYGCAVGALTAAWVGPSAAAMQQAAASFVAWLTATAGLAEHTANQTRAAAAAFEAAFVATMSPEVVAANRTRLAALVATNWLGENTAAIAATEAHYVEMWAQDAAAMYGYAASSALARQLAPFASAPQITQAAAIPDPTTVVGNVVAELGQLTGLSASPGDLFDAYAQALLSSGLQDMPVAVLALFTSLWAVEDADTMLGQLEQPASAMAVPVAPTVLAPPVMVAAPQVNVSTGNRIGQLAVPPTWARPQPPATSLEARCPVAEGGEQPLPVPLSLAAPGARTNAERKTPPEYGTRPTFMTRPPSGG